MAALDLGQGPLFVEEKEEERCAATVTQLSNDHLFAALCRGEADAEMQRHAAAWIASRIRWCHELAETLSEARKVIARIVSLEVPEADDVSLETRLVDGRWWDDERRLWRAPEDRG